MLDKSYLVTLFTSNKSIANWGLKHKKKMRVWELKKKNYYEFQIDFFFTQ